MDTPFEAYVTNLGKYNEGRLVGEFLKFPTTTEEVQALLKRIGIDGVRYGDELETYDDTPPWDEEDEDETEGDK